MPTLAGGNIVFARRLSDDARLEVVASIVTCHVLSFIVCCFPLLRLSTSLRMLWDDA